MKKISCIIFLLTVTFYGYSQVQPQGVQELKEELAAEKVDSNRAKLMGTIALATRFSNIDTSLYYTEMAMQLAEKAGPQKTFFRMINLKGATLLEAGKIPEALAAQYDLLRRSEAVDYNEGMARALNAIGNIYMELGDYRKANEYYFLSADKSANGRVPGLYHNEYSNIGNIYNFLGMPDSSLYYLNFVRRVSDSLHVLNDRTRIVRGELFFRLGNAYRLKGDTVNALKNYHQAISEAKFEYDLRNLAMSNVLLATFYKERKNDDSSSYYAYRAIESGKLVSFNKGIYEAAKLLSDLFKKQGRYDSAFKYLDLASAMKESLTGTERFKKLQRIIMEDEEQRKAEEVRTLAATNRQRQSLLVVGLAIFLIIASILSYNNRQKRSANKALQSTLKELRATQSQLVHSEKMASLGELTAGIAHEIQNPLNFVNNFSELNTELIEELKEAAAAGQLEEVRTLVASIDENEKKINYHGKRADSIVKSMLQHSRTGSSVKEPADLNVLAEEFARLAYHGLRAREKNFNASIETSFDSGLGKVSIISQDIGRVLLNIINNAFYAMAEKKKREPSYNPVLRISTVKKPGTAELHIADNGPGIPPAVLEKIFQPFFTTKPTGLGTGLGLSLSYDIITKGHGGSIKVETKEGQGTEFIISLPL